MHAYFSYNTAKVFEHFLTSSNGSNSIGGDDIHKNAVRAAGMYIYVTN